MPFILDVAVPHSEPAASLTDIMPIMRAFRQQQSALINGPHCVSSGIGRIKWHGDLGCARQYNKHAFLIGTFAENHGVSAKRVVNLPGRRITPRFASWQNERRALDVLATYGSTGAASNRPGCWCPVSRWLTFLAFGLSEPITDANAVLNSGSVAFVQLCSMARTCSSVSNRPWR